MKPGNIPGGLLLTAVGLLLVISAVQIAAAAHLSPAQLLFAWLISHLIGFSDDWSFEFLDRCTFQLLGGLALLVGAWRMVFKPAASARRWSMVLRL